MRTATMILIGITFCMSSCATIITGSTDPVSFNSDPEGALITVDGTVVGRTPCQAEVGRGWNTGDIVMVYKGERYETSVPRVFNGWYVGNIAFGLTGIAVGAILIDLPTGNIRKTPDGTTIYYCFEGWNQVVPADPPENAAKKPDA